MSSTTLQWLATKDEMTKFVEQHDNFVIDCDGVIWAAGNLLPNAKETLTMLASAEKKLVFVTNNSSKSRSQYLEKFRALGITQDILPSSANTIIPSTYAASMYLAEHLHASKDGGVVLVLGSTGLVQEIQSKGFRTKTLDRDFQITSEDEFISLNVHDEKFVAVVVGADMNMNFSQIAYASAVLQHHRTNDSFVFICTSRDAFDQVTPERRIPGMTAVLAGIESSCAGRKATTVGKPSSWLASHVLTEFNLEPTRTCMIGDRLDSDIVFGAAGGMTTLLVMTGCTTKEDLNNEKRISVLPNYVSAGFGQLSLGL